MGSSSFLGLSSIEEEGKCLICNKAFRIKDKIHCFGVDSWPKFTEQAEERSELKTHKDNNEYVYKSVHSKLNGTEEPFWKPDRSCKRVWFKTPKKCGKIWRQHFLLKMVNFYH